ncbi:DUF58 domain-containing protein [Phytoactinopolyspora mesophila]|uniref:DUF58 domain-containing protein n=1 Tax=Phytoactinopolyspora mesophila TaxID=2650750 RepID=A0A7K3M0C5_9ACTN|nr:DUF58 domain-containing protein [Phytoactinopolyspora mesophila]NDL56700.1 DUF58 domain-containing protein [Phytoactinopolyspora mesophila]
MSWLSKRRYWIPTPAYSRAVALPVVLTGFALVLGRTELLLLGVPLALGAALAHGRHSALARAWTGESGLGAPPEVRVIGPERLDSGHRAKLATSLAPSSGQFVTVILPPTIQDGDGERVAVQAPGRDHEPRQIVTEMEITTWGTHVLARPTHLVAADDALWVAGPTEGAPFTAKVLPAITSRLPSGALPPRPAGMVGAHRTRRPGEGTELHEISPFVPGDRLRRIDWRVTSRQSGVDEQLYTRRTLVDADADVMCCLDNRYDLSADVAQWSASSEVTPREARDHGSRTSIDLAVDTVSSIAAAYLAHGDRVGMIDLSNPATLVRPASGSRHLIRLRNHLARHTRRPSSGDLARLARRIPAFPPGSIIVVTSVFFDDDIVDVAAGWRRAGHPVLAADVLPEPLRVPSKNREMAVALRIVLAERDERLAALTAQGVTVTPADPGQLALNLARLARAPRRSRHR